MIKHHFNNLKLSRKLLILYLFSVFIPIILTNIIFYHVTTENIKEQKMHDISLALEQIKNDFRESIDDAVGVSSVLYTDNKINEILDRQYESHLDYLEQYDANLRGFNKYGAIFSSVDAIHFYTDNETLLYSGGVNYLSEELMETKAYLSLPKKRNHYPTVIRTDNMFSVIKELNYFKVFNNTTKIVRIDLSNDTIEHIFKNVTFQGDVYLLDDKGVIKYSTNTQINWQDDSLPFDQELIPLGAITLQEKYTNVNYLNGWTMVGVVSEQELLQDVYKSRKSILYLASWNFLVPTIIIILISNSINVRLRKILMHMKKMKNQDFEIIEGIDYKDEIGQLITEYNRMSAKIKELINNVYRTNLQKKNLELQKKQAQLSALQSQINPHFLFNTLETIRMRSLIKEETETAKIIQNMAKMLRRSFTWGKDWVTVKEEMQIILSFLEIQKYRFEDKLDFEIDIDETAYDFVIPNLILLPFVENASIHGVEPKKNNGKILITIKPVGYWYEFTVIDNGPGFDPDSLQMLKNSLKTEESMGEHIGIKNVYYRLKMYYNDQFYFDIENGKDHGTKVTIRLPKIDS